MLFDVLFRREGMLLAYFNGKESLANDIDQPSNALAGSQPRRRQQTLTSQSLRRFQLALRFSEKHDSSGIEFPQDFNFPRWFWVQGEQLGSVHDFVAASPDALLTTTWNGTNITRRQVSAHLVSRRGPWALLVLSMDECDAAVAHFQIQCFDSQTSADGNLNVRVHSRCCRTL